MFVSIIPGSDISVLPQHSERLGVLFGGGLSSLPSYCFEFFSLWEQSQLIGPHASCRFSLPIWLLYHILLFPADEGRSCSFMQVLTLHGVILNFSVRFHVAAARLPFICTKTFPAPRKRKSEISLCWQDFRVFHQWRQKHDANPLCSECGISAVASP